MRVKHELMYIHVQFMLESLIPIARQSYKQAGRYSYVLSR